MKDVKMDMRENNENKKEWRKPDLKLLSYKATLGGNTPLFTEDDFQTPGSAS